MNRSNTTQTNGPRDHLVVVRLTKTERARAQRAARRAGTTVSKQVRDYLLRWAERILAK